MNPRETALTIAMNVGNRRSCLSKWGLKTGSAITQDNVGEFHVAAECPIKEV